MAVIGIILLALLLGYHYMNHGLFRGAVTLITLFVAVLAGITLGPGVFHYLELVTPERFAGTVAAVGILGFGAQRAFLGPLDMDIDFHPWLERIGGGLTGACSGVLLGGFTSVCLLCLNSPSLSRGEDNLRQAGNMILGPCRVASALFPGPYRLTIDGVVHGQLEERDPEPENPDTSQDGTDPSGDVPQSPILETPGQPPVEPPIDPHEENQSGAASAKPPGNSAENANSNG